MSATYRPGQLYTGADGDLLFVVLAPSQRIAFVTNRSSIIDVEHVERVYAPLRLVRDVDGPALPTPGRDTTGGDDTSGGA